MSGCSTSLPDRRRINWGPILKPKGPWSPLVNVGATPAKVAKRCAGIVYLSTPYIEAAQVRGVWRVERSTRASVLASVEACQLASLGCTSLSPAVLMAEMAHARVLFEGGPDPLDRAYWEEWTQPFLSAASAVVVPAIEGWDRCAVVWRDLRYALGHNLPVYVYAQP